MPARDARVIRCEVLDGKLLYAIALNGAGSTFDLCPADVCMVDKPTITIEALPAAARDGRGGRAHRASPPAWTSAASST